MEQLRKLQLVETEMLSQWDALCSKYKIDYFVLFGTALGAVRHKGFIPWDDDIDIGMLRSDYEKIKQIPADEWNGLQLLDGDSYCFYHEKLFPRVYKPGTVFEPEAWNKYVNNPENIRKPVWIDILLFDYVDSKKEAEKKAKTARKYNMQYYYSRYQTNIVSKDSLKDKIKCFAKKMMHYLFGTLHKPDYYLQKYYKLVRKETGKYLISFDSWRIHDIICTFGERDMYFPVKRMNFENIIVSAPNNINLMLTQTFGDYMKLPPLDQQKAHVPHTIHLDAD